MPGYEKTNLYWVGLMILALASVGLFQIFWTVVIVIHPMNRVEFLKRVTPIIAAGVVFILIGVYMMISGKRNRKVKRRVEKGEQEDDLLRKLSKLEATLRAYKKELHMLWETGLIQVFPFFLFSFRSRPFTLQPIHIPKEKHTRTTTIRDISSGVMPVPEKSKRKAV